MRSAKPPTTSATVMQAKDARKATWIIWLMLPVTLSMPMPFSIAVSNPPNTALPSLNAAVAIQHPQHADQREGDGDLRQHRQHVLPRSRPP